MWFSPSGGFLFFWPALSLCAILACAGILMHYRRKKRLDSRALPFAALCVFQFVLTVGLSKWHAPFGWICWGSRLHLPWMLPSAFLLGIIYSNEVEAFANRYFGSLGVKILAGLLLGVCCLPHLFVAIDYRILQDVFRPTEVCPIVPILSQTFYYYKCMHEYLWPTSFTLVRSFNLIAWNAQTIAVSGLYLLACVFGFAALRVGAAKPSRSTSYA